MKTNFLSRRAAMSMASALAATTAANLPFGVKAAAAPAEIPVPKAFLLGLYETLVHIERGIENDFFPAAAQGSEFAATITSQLSSLSTGLLDNGVEPEELDALVPDDVPIYKYKATFRHADGLIDTFHLEATDDEHALEEASHLQLEGEILGVQKGIFLRNI